MKGIFVFLVFWASLLTVLAKKPHIIIIVADDLVRFHIFFLYLLFRILFITLREFWQEENFAKTIQIKFLPKFLLF